MELRDSKESVRQRAPPTLAPDNSGGAKNTSNLSPVNNTEKSPLIYSAVWSLRRSLSRGPGDDDDDDDRFKTPDMARRTLGTYGGVFAAVALAQFSTNLFLRTGFVVGQAGLIQALVQFCLAYFILVMTILSISAISTNGAVEGGGAYYMISRALGPEFGGSIGFLFFLANIFSSALYISGFVEGLIDNFGPGGRITEGLPGDSRWWAYLYASVVLLFCLGVCMIGGTMFARTSLVILFIVVVCTLSVIVSVFVVHPKCVGIPKSNKYAFPDIPVTNTTPANQTEPCGNYTGLSLQTFKDNLFDNYSLDYVTGNVMTFASVFAVLFSSVTGIMNGANMSGELKDPGRSIPQGTLLAGGFTFITYLILALLAAASSSRYLLLNNYIFLQQINVWAPFVVIGIFAATLSAALGNLIGASRVLEALAKDELFGPILKPATITTKGGNPWVAVLISWGLVQLVLMIGSLNAIAPMTSVFFLLSYAATNLACLALELASAPNFRPTFRYFSWLTCLLGLIGCMVMCFLISSVYASAAIIAFLLIVMLLHLRSVPTSWGSISQALIFHQVRKYLLLLDSRKDHVKYWRPQILLMVSNPRGSCELIDFINDIKKGGLYVLGHVKQGDFDGMPQDPTGQEYSNWLSLVDWLKVKAFVELTVSRTVREGMHHLIRLSGLGGMKPNTIIFGFYDSTNPEDSFQKRAQKTSKVRFYTLESGSRSADTISDMFPFLRQFDDRKNTPKEEYVQMVFDAMKMQKNVCLCRHFQQLNKKAILSSKTTHYIDAWPVNFFQPDRNNYYDNTSLFLLQLGCILNMVSTWRSKTTLRIFLPTEAGKTDEAKKEKKMRQLLKELRIPAEIRLIPWEHVVKHLDEQTEPVKEGATFGEYSTPLLPEEYQKGVNQLIKENSMNTAVTFFYLPRAPPQADMQRRYLHQLDTITEDLPPTVLVYAVHPVTSTTL